MRMGRRRSPEPMRVNPDISPRRRNIRPSGFDSSDLRHFRSGLTLSKVRKHRVETSAGELSPAEVLMKRTYPRS